MTNKVQTTCVTIRWRSRSSLNAILGTLGDAGLCCHSLGGWKASIPYRAWRVLRSEMESARHASRGRSCVSAYPTLLHRITCRQNNKPRRPGRVGTRASHCFAHACLVGWEERYDVRDGARGRSAAEDVVTRHVEPTDSEDRGLQRSDMYLEASRVVMPKEADDVTSGKVVSVDRRCSLPCPACTPPPLHGASCMATPTPTPPPSLQHLNPPSISTTRTYTHARTHTPHRKPLSIPHRHGVQLCAFVHRHVPRADRRHQPHVNLPRDRPDHPRRVRPCG
jgi:hypothetical protein